MQIFFLALLRHYIIEYVLLLKNKHINPQYLYDGYQDYEYMEYII